jgi:hypothetical protein
LTYKIENDGVQELNQLEKTPKSTQHTHARTVCHDRGTHAQTHTHRKIKTHTHTQCKHKWGKHPSQRKVKLQSSRLRADMGESWMGVTTPNG